MAINKDGTEKKLTDKQRLGNLGEDIACKFLMKQGFVIENRNYWKKWGEIDIVARNNGVTHFIEVKSVSRENFKNVNRETDVVDAYRPEDNVHPWKIKRLQRVIQTYILDKKLLDAEWQFDVAIVQIDIKARKARVEMLPNIVL